MKQSHVDRKTNSRETRNFPRKIVSKFRILFIFTIKMLHMTEAQSRISRDMIQCVLIELH